MKFLEYIAEAASGKNLHMEHIEDNILNGGVYGAREAINFLRKVRDMLAGNSESKVNITVKWDGAPAIFAGQDPSDGQFFVAKKGIFNKNPKLYKTNAEIDADTSGDLADKLKASRNVWFDNADYKDVSGKASMTKEETAEVTKVLSQAGKVFNAIDGRFLDSLSDYPGFGEELNTRIKAFNNSKIKQRQKIANVHSHVTEMLDALLTHYQSEFDSKKKPDAKKRAEVKVNAIKSMMKSKYKVQFEHIFTLMNLLVDAKDMLSKKLDEVKSVNTFLLTKSGYQVTGVEGYVAIDKLTGGAVKIVDRLQFSYANFSPDVIKGWER
ncbi:hypothetical protein EB118_18580 [bacterium]|nr:hypothetical protein [bacterium]